MKHAYYLAEFDKTFGDEEYGKDLKDIYNSFFYYCTGRSDIFTGVSRFDGKNGVVVRITCVNFFDEKLAPFVIDL